MNRKPVLSGPTQRIWSRLTVQTISLHRLLSGDGEAHFQNDFLSRINWTIMNYEEANHPPVPKLAHPNEITVKSNEIVKLDATPTTDPDGDNLTYNWYLYFEPGTYLLYTDYQSNRNHQLDIENSDKPVATFIAPKTNKQADMHIILEVTDDGVPNLTRYQRVIVNILPPE
jgi:hypothetical protein